MSDKESRPLATGGDRRDLRAAGSYSHTHHTASGDGRQGPKHGKIVAGGSVWAKQVRASAHLLRKPYPAWACDQADALAAWHIGVVWLCVHDLESGKRYWATLRDLLENAALFDRGFGPQLALPLTAWHVGERPPKQAAMQLGLFEGGRP